MWRMQTACEGKASTFVCGVPDTPGRGVSRKYPKAGIERGRKALACFFEADERLQRKRRSSSSRSKSKLLVKVTEKGGEDDGLAV